MRISDCSSDVCSSDHLLHERINRGHVRHHEEADGVEAELAAKADMLFRHIGFGAVRRDMDAARTAVRGHAKLVERPDSGHVKDRNGRVLHRSEEHTSELQSLMRISYAVFFLKKKTTPLQ